PDFAADFGPPARPLRDLGTPSSRRVGPPGLPVPSTRTSGTAGRFGFGAGAASFVSPPAASGALVAGDSAAFAVFRGRGFGRIRRATSPSVRNRQPPVRRPTSV